MIPRLSERRAGEAATEREVEQKQQKQPEAAEAASGEALLAEAGTS